MKRVWPFLWSLVLVLLVSGCATTGKFELTALTVGNELELFRLNKETGDVWQFTPERKWELIPEMVQDETHNQAAQGTARKLAGPGR